MVANTSCILTPRNVSRRVSAHTARKVSPLGQKQFQSRNVRRQRRTARTTRALPTYAASAPAEDIRAPAAIPADYLCDELASAFGPALLFSQASTRITRTNDTILPSSLPATTFTTVPASHIIAVGAPSSSNVSLHAAHHDVILGHCNRVPALSAPVDVPAGHLPVQTLVLPHPSSFSALNEYFCVHRQDLLLRRIQPRLNIFGSQTHTATCAKNVLDDAAIAQHAESLRSVPVAQLQATLQWTKGLAANMIALGVSQTGAWEVLDAAARIHDAAINASL
ncbi:hypothetical protein CYLTODRAFT_426074 [Cylindrobasidium torrendii FP15055 ss-10]|uniref:Uncharacterized protein n=1 Tax=Cylindrobasidium torrendii FP15055 ss-10 TaxID=1314674 RepID=A0A0D7B1T4_9AGAR|nr:hypothetical protein CYLTODRAFT_426074 [Cylindrobasidium torrendii FP15055 ss-10]